MSSEGKMFCGIGKSMVIQVHFRLETQTLNYK